MHCHTKEGSMDGKIPIAEYIQILKSKGFQGMLVTDHDSYNGFRKYRDHLKGSIDNFVVLKGIEYDTIDAGHILVILPEHVKLLLMECRGLPVRVLQDVEAFNACESPESNTDARKLAMQYGLPMFGGSDSHHPDCVGTAYTEVKSNVTCESELISYVKEAHSVNYGGEYYHGTVKGKLGIFNHVLVEGFWFYNHFASMYRHHKRKLALSLLNQ